EIEKRHYNHRVASVLRIRSPLTSKPQNEADFGFGTLARFDERRANPRLARWANRPRSSTLPGWQLAGSSGYASIAAIWMQRSTLSRRLSATKQSVFCKAIFRAPTMNTKTWGESATS